MEKNTIISTDRWIVHIIISHHALADGLHVGKYFQLIQEIMDNPEKYYKSIEWRISDFIHKGVSDITSLGCTIRQPPYHWIYLSSFSNAIK